MAGKLAGDVRNSCLLTSLDQLILGLDQSLINSVFDVSTHRSVNSCDII